MGRASRKNRIKKIWGEVEPSLRSQLIVLAQQGFKSQKDFDVFADQLAELKHLSFEDHMDLCLLVENLFYEVVNSIPLSEEEPIKYQVHEFSICDHQKRELEALSETERLAKIGEHIRGM